MQLLQQLTRLHLGGTLTAVEGTIPASAYSALTASSRLQRLDMHSVTLPTGAWQHVFPDGRQLPYLQELLLQDIRQPGGVAASAPEGSRLVSCCPGLQYLYIWGLECDAGLLAPGAIGPMQGLSRLHRFVLQVGKDCSHGGRMGVGVSADTVEGAQFVYSGHHRGAAAADTAEAVDKLALRGSLGRC
jgi:hypothetical protein